MKKSTAFAILAIASLLFVFSLGILTSQQGIAQGGVINVPYMRILPLQRDLWSFSADGANTWLDGIGHVLVVKADNSGRLPVLTTIYAHSTHDAYFTNLHREVDGNWHIWEISDDTSVGNAGSQTRFHDTGVGVVLQPGRYAIGRKLESSNSDSHELLLSGYWAPR